MDIKIEELKTIYSTSDNLNGLRKHILSLAFSGKLSTQEYSDTIEEVVNDIINSRKKVKKKINININKEEQYIDIPKEWRWVRLDWLGDIYNGNSISKSLKENKYSKVSDGYNYIATKDVGYGDNINYSTGIKVPVDEAKFKVAPEGSVLICSEGGSAGKKIGMVNKTVTFGNKLFAIVPNHLVISEWVYYFYQSNEFYQEFAGKMNGIIGGISKSNFINLLIPIASIEEMKEIVSKVKTLMGQVDNIETMLSRKEELVNLLPESIVDTIGKCENYSEIKPHIEFIVENFDTIFQSSGSMQELRNVILQLAIEGKLLPQNDSDEPASFLLERISDKRSSFIKNKKVKSSKSKAIKKDEVKFDIPDSWEWIRLSELCKRDIAYGIILLGPEDSNGVNVLRCSDVKYRNIETHKIRTVTKSKSEEFSRTVLQGGEVVVNVRGTLGGCAVVPDAMKGYNLAREVAVIDTIDVDNNYILNVISSVYFFNFMFGSLRGIAYKGLNIGTLSNLLIPVPPLEEQHRIVERVNSIMRTIDMLEEKLKMKQEVNKLLGTI